MAFYKQDIVDVNLETGVIHRSFLNHTIGHKDDDADRFGIRAFRNGEPVDLSGAQCQAVFMAPDGTNIALTSYGTVSGNEAYVTLPQACYDVEGQFCLAIKLVGGGVTATVRIIDGVVDRTGATGAVAPTEAVPTYQEILAVYAEMQEDVADYESVVATQNGKIDDLKSATNYIEDIIVGGKVKNKEATISNSGVVEYSAARDLTCFRVQPGSYITATGTFDLYAFYASKPEMGSVSYNASRTIESAINNLLVPSGCNWIAIRHLPEYDDLFISPESYTIGAIQSKISGLERFGVNIEWEQGRISTSGEDVESSYTIRSNNYIKVSPSDTLYIDIPLNGFIHAWFYDSNKGYLSRIAEQKSNISIPSNAVYMRVAFSYGASTDIGIDEAQKVHIYCTNSNDGNILHSICGGYSVPDWTANTKYIVGNIVKNSGLTYICKVAHTSASTFDSSKFSQVNLCMKTDVMSNRLVVDYAATVPDITKPSGTVFYNTTLHAVLFTYVDNNIVYNEAVPRYHNTVYVLDGIEYVYDETKCSLVPHDNNYMVVMDEPIESGISGKGIYKDGTLISTASYNITKPIELNVGDIVYFTTYVNAAFCAIAKTDAAGSYYEPIVIGHSVDAADTYSFIANQHMFIAATFYYDYSKSLIYSKKPVVSTITPEWEMLGFFNRYGAIQSISQSVPNYSISKPMKLYAGDKITMTCWAVANDPALIEYQDRWNTYWANSLGNANVLIMPTTTGTGTYKCIVPKTAYYVFSCNVTDETTPEITIERTQDSTAEIDVSVFNDEANYGLDRHNYVDKYDYVPDLVAKRANAILTYSADDKKSNNYMVNAVAYPNGEIIACRAGGQVVKIANDGTETVLLTIANAQDWRGMFMDSKLNVYVSPHSSTFSPGISATDRGLYRLAYGASSFTKVISLCRSTTEIREWTANTAYAVGDKIIRDNQSDAYICKTAHTSSNTFDSSYWNAVADWAQSTSYSVGALCRYNSCYFRCISDHVSGTSFDATKWDAATEYMDNDDTIWTMCEDSKGYLYAGVYSHSIRANPAVYRSSDDGNYFFYQHNFIMNGTLPESTYGFNAVRHVHCINYNPYDDCLYAAVGEVNTIVKSSNKGTTWQDLHVACYYGQPTYILGVKDGLVIGSDGHYSCGVSKLMTDGKTMKLCGRTAPGFIFNIRRSDLTGWLYAWTRIDNIVANETQCPPYEAVDDIDAYNEWVANAPASTLRFWNPYHEWAEKYYPEDARRPQNAVIMVSKDEGDTWEVINKVKVSQNEASICGYITVGYFRDGECLAGLLKPIDNTESGKAFVQPVVISEGKKKRTADGYDLDGEIFIKTNNSNIVGY